MKKELYGFDLESCFKLGVVLHAYNTSTEAGGLQV